MVLFAHAAANPHSWADGHTAIPLPATPNAAITDALRVLQPLRAELESLAKFVLDYRADAGGVLPYQLSDLPRRLQHASSQCRHVHKQLNTARSHFNGRQYATRDGSSPLSEASEPRGRSLSPGRGANAASPSSQRHAHEGHSLRAAPAGASSNGASSAASPDPTGARVASGADDGGGGNGSGGGGMRVQVGSPRACSDGGRSSASERQRSPSPSRLLMLSRWPENAVEPRQPVTMREKAIKDAPSHPLRVFYVNAPSAWCAEPTANEIRCRDARQTLNTLRMMGGATRRKNWLKIVFYEWVVVSVGQEEKRQKRIQTAEKRRKAFFEPGRGGNHLHLQRRSPDKTRFEDSAYAASPRLGGGGDAFATPYKESGYNPSDVSERRQVWDYQRMMMARGVARGPASTPRASSAPPSRVGASRSPGSVPTLELERAGSGSRGTRVGGYVALGEVQGLALAQQD